MRSAVWAGDWPITQPWGPTTLSVEPLYGTIHWHCGVDIGMPSNTPLYAARAGVVSRTGFGLLGVQSGGECHYYIHIDRALVGMGAAVATGQLIAYSGAKVPAGGYLTGPHLHFERNWQALNLPPGLDPMALLEARYGPGSGNTSGGQMATEQEIETALKATGVVGGITSLFQALVGPVPAQGQPIRSLWDKLDALQKSVDANTAAIKAMPAPAAEAEPKTLSGTITGTLT